MVVVTRQRDYRAIVEQKYISPRQSQLFELLATNRNSL